MESTQEPKDTTFRVYTSNQAATYAANRGEHPDELNQTIIEYHISTKGSFDTLLDVGCGPGNSTRGFAKFFRTAIGADPSPSMIEQARKLPGNKSIRFESATSETLDTIPDLARGSVDLLTAGAAAHWFDMSKFWAQAAKILKPGGTVAIWTQASLYCHPETTPNAAKVQEILHWLEFVELEPYRRTGDKLYKDLPLPWQVDPKVPEFAEEDHLRRVWNEDGKIEPGERFMRQKEITLQEFADASATASTVTKWREAHPELVGTEKDCVNVAVRKLKEAPGHPDCDMAFDGGCSIVLLLFKKRTVE